MRICIDAGHGGEQPGAVNKKRLEKNDNLLLGIKVRDALHNRGVNVKMIRSTDIDIDLMKRCEIANRAKCDYYLSIHRDSASGSAQGASIYVFSDAGVKSIKYATEILNAAVKAGGFKNRGVHKGAPLYSDFAVNKYTNMPAALLEVGYISNLADNKKFDKNINKIAEAIAEAILNIVKDMMKL